MSTEVARETPAAAVEDARRAERTDRIVGTIQRQGALAVLIVVVVISLIAFPNFRSFDNTATILVAAAPPMLIALGMTFVILTGGIDLSVGSLYVLGGVLAAWASQYGFVAAFAVPLAVCAVIFAVAGFTTPLEPTTVAAYAAPVRRPFYSVLDNAALRDAGLDRMRPWQVALEDYLARRAHASKAEHPRPT